MREVSRPQSKWSASFFLIAPLVVIADQFTKLWIRSNLGLGEAIFETGFFRITHAQNTGAAFGLFQGHSLPLAIVALVSVVVLLVYVLFFRYRLPFLNNRWCHTALGLMLGGIIGNLIDRLVFGYVTDFIYFNYWPPFNVADSAITVGSLMFAGYLIFFAWSEKRLAGS